MKTLKSFGLVMSMMLMSLPCFAGTRFYCPDPSNLHIEETQWHSYYYIGTNEVGIVFKSALDYLEKPNPFHRFSGADGVYNDNEIICLYDDLNLVRATVHQKFEPVGSGWVKEEGGYYYCKKGLSRNDCAFEFISK